MGIKQFFKNIFSKELNKPVGYSELKMLNEFTPRFLNFSNNQYDNLIYRACIDRISSQVAKLTPTVSLDGVNSFDYFVNLEFLLNNKPNEYMNRYDFFYKICSMLLDTNNVFVYKRVLDNRIVGLYPINYRQIEFLDVNSEIYAKFSFKNNGFEVYIPYNELIHIRRHYNESDLFGSNQKEVLAPIFEVLRAIDEGMINAVEASTKLRGILKYSNNLNPKDLTRLKDDFVKSYMGINGDGIGALDTKADFIQTNIQPYTVDAEHQKQTIEYMTMHFGVSEKILKGEASEDEYNAFYEICIEPLLVQLSNEITNKLFTKMEIIRGCSIQLTANKLLFANNSTKTTIAKEMMQTGVFSINEVRDFFGYEKIKDGDRHIISLNYVDLKNANKYQIGTKDNEEEK